MGKIKKEIGLPKLVEYSEREWNYILRLYKGKKNLKEIYKVVVCATIYNLWWE